MIRLVFGHIHIDKKILFLISTKTDYICKAQMIKKIGYAL